MEKKTVDVIIPAYRPGEGWKQMLRGLEGQTWPVHRLIVMNTGKEKWKAAYEKTTIPMEVHHLTREEFDIDMKMNSVTVRDASANGEAFTHNVDKQKHKYKKKEDWVWDYLIRRSVISAERK